MRGKLFSLDHMAVGCVVIAGVIEATQQALTSAPRVSDVLPHLATSPNVNYLPLGLITVAAMLWIVRQFRNPVPLSASDAERSVLTAGSAIARSLPGIVIQHADVVNIIQRGPDDYDATVRLHTVSLHATAGAVASIEMQVGRGELPLDSEKGPEITALKAQLSSIAAREYPPLSQSKINELSEALLALPRVVVGRDNRHIDIRRDELGDSIELADGIARAFQAADWRMMDEPKKPASPDRLPPGIWVIAPPNDPRAPLIADLLGKLLGSDYGPISTKIEASMDFGFPNFLDKLVVVRIAIGRKMRSAR